MYCYRNNLLPPLFFNLFFYTNKSEKIHNSLPRPKDLEFLSCSNHFVKVSQIDHFRVVGLVTWPLNGSEAGVDLVLIETSLLMLCKSSCSYAN